jgi:hypothetical protein
MIVSITHPQTAEWMKDYMDPMILILETILLRDKALRDTFKSRGLTLGKILNDLREGVQKHHESKEKFGVYFSQSKGKGNLSYRLEPLFFVFFKNLIDSVLRNPPPLPPQKEEKKESSAPKPAVNEKFAFELKVVMKTLQDVVWNFSPKEGTILNILGGILNESSIKVLYGRGYTFCRLCVRTMEDVDLVIKNLNGKKFDVPKSVRLSVELMQEQKESRKGKPAPEATSEAASEAAPEAASEAASEVASGSSRYVKVKIVRNDSQKPEIIPPHEASFLMFAFSTKTDTFPVDIKICHQICKRDFLLLKIDSVQNAEVAMQKMNGQKYFYGENHFKSLHTLEVTFTEKF